jgi:hypothetical protein
VATYVQRTVSICDAIVNGTSTLAQQTAIVSAICPNLPAEWTQAQKCQAFVTEVRARILRFRQAQIQAAGIETAIATGASQAASEIPES